MTEVSLCSIDTKSTAGDGKMSQHSLDGDDSISLPENLRRILRNREEQKSTGVEKGNHASPSSARLGDAGRRDILESISEAVKNWDETEKLSNNPKEAARSSLSSPGKFGLRERLEYSLKLSEASRKTSLSNPLNQEEKQEVHDKCSNAQQKTRDKYQPAILHDEGKTQEKEFPEPAEELSAVLKKYQHPRTPRCYGKSSSLPEEATKQQALEAKQQAQAKSNLFLRLTRQVQYGRQRGLAILSRGGANKIKLHVYDLIPAETVMQLPWGCIFPIGRCFDALNNGLHSIGTGAYHVGVEINGIEYAYGACDISGHTGVFSCVPRRSPGYQYRTTIDFGERILLKKTWLDLGNAQEEKTSESKAPSYREVERYVDGREVIKEMATEYMGIDYDLLRKNCVTFASDACMRLGVKEEEIPTWFRNLCESGALTQDVALQTVEPIQNIFSACEDYGDFDESHLEDGFEVITTVDGQVVREADTVETGHYFPCTDFPTMAVRKTLSWTY